MYLHQQSRNLHTELCQEGRRGRRVPAATVGFATRRPHRHPRCGRRTQFTSMRFRLRLFLVLFLSLIYVSVCGQQKRSITQLPTNQGADAESARLRKQQLHMLHEDLLSRTLDSIKKMDEVALRISARNQMLQYLWESKVLSDKYLSLKRTLALDTIPALNTHHLEIPKFMPYYRLAQGEDVKQLNFWLDELRKQKPADFDPLLREVIVIAERGPQLSFETLLWLNPIYSHSKIPI